MTAVPTRPAPVSSYPSNKCHCHTDDPAVARMLELMAGGASQLTASRIAFLHDGSWERFLFAEYLRSIDELVAAWRAVADLVLEAAS